jgi:hypothetical protein
MAAGCPAGSAASGPPLLAAGTHSCSHIFPITGKLTGTFRDFGKKFAISAQIPQFLLLEQGLTGNFKFFDPSHFDAKGYEGSGGRAQL